MDISWHTASPPHWEDSFPATVAGLARVLLDAEWPYLCSIFSLRMGFGSCSYEDLPNAHISRQTITASSHQIAWLPHTLPALPSCVLAFSGGSVSMQTWHLTLNTSVSPYRIKEFYHRTVRLLSGSAKLTPNSRSNSLKDLSKPVVAYLFNLFSLHVT